MKKKGWVGLLAGLAAVASFAAPSLAADEEAEPKYTIKVVMKDAMKGPLLKKVASGEASDEEKKTLHAMFVAIQKEEPKKGDAESWKEKTAALVVAAKAAMDGKEDAADLLKKASNCKACHSVHK